MTYSTRRPDIDDSIADLVAAAGDGANDDLIRELVTTAVKLQRDEPARGDLKLINTALKEMRYSSLVFAQHQTEPKVTVFGSARTPSDDPNYVLAKEFGRRMAEIGWGIITGAGPGIMRAANEGAGRDHSYGVNIRLPFEDSANEYLDPAKTINFKYFFTRKLGFVKEAHGFALFPGGFGTMDETYELLTLMQTGKSDLHPIVLVEAEGTDYWTKWAAFADDLVGEGLISSEDRSLYVVTNDLDEAISEICGFYANYHSQRYVNGRLILRIRQAPTEPQLAALNDEFGDLLSEGVISSIEATPPEVADGDVVDLPRLSFSFDRRHFSRLRLLIDRLNGFAEARTGLPGDAFTAAQADRDW